MKQIKLTQGKFALVDDDIYELIGHLKWSAARDGNTYRAIRHTSTKDDLNGKQHTIRLHSIIMGKPPKGQEILHKDGNGLNNQRSNLRFGTHRENMQERIEHRNGHLVGANWDKRAERWKARIHINNKRKSLGYFNTEMEAHLAYVKALKELKDAI